MRPLHKLGTPAVDLLASRRTAQLRKYMTLDKKDTQALAVDSLSQPWNFKFLYAFSSPILVPVVVNKLKGSDCRMLLVVPCRMELLYDTPRRLPLLPDLLINVEMGYPVSKLDKLRLVVWPLCDRLQGSTFSRQLSLSWNAAEGVAHANSTSQPGPLGNSGVPVSLWTQLPSL